MGNAKPAPFKKKAAKKTAKAAGAAKGAKGKKTPPKKKAGY